MALLSAETAAPFQLLSLSFFHLACADGPPSPSPWFWLLRRWCMLSHECEFAPASLLDLACLLTLSSSSQGCPPPPSEASHRQLKAPERKMKKLWSLVAP